MKINGKSNSCLTLLTIVSASVVLGAISVSVAGAQAAAVIVADSKANTLIAQRQELKDEISKFGEKNAGRASIAITKLLNLENPDDIIYLLGLMIKNPKSPMAEEIKKIILGHGKKKYLVTALKKAGQDQSTDVNIAAANLLIDMKEKLEGLKVMVALIKKGIVDKRVIGIMERVPTPDKLNGVKMADGKIIYNIEIQQSLQEIYKTGTFPQDLQVFTLLMLGAYYNNYDLRNEHEKMSEILAKADHEYLMNSLHLLKKAVAVYQFSPNVPWELVKQLTGSKDAAVAKLAREIDEWREKEEEKKWNKEAEGGPEIDPTFRDVRRYQYLSRFGDSEKNVKYIIGLINKEKDGKLREEMLETLMESKQEKIILPYLKKVALEDSSARVRAKAVQVLIKKGYEEESFELLPKEIDLQYFILKGRDGRNIFSEFKKTEIKNKVAKYLASVGDDEKNELLIRGLAIVNLAKYDLDLGKRVVLIISYFNDQKTTTQSA
jgi:HEAT repeat protein